MRALTFCGLVLILLATGFGAAAATQGCDDCRELKKEYRDSALASYTPAAARPTATPGVRMILYWSNECGDCDAVLDGVLPSLQEQYGAQLAVRLVEVVSLEDISAFFDVAEGYGFARGKAAVPFLLIGERALSGVEQIEAQLPQLVEAHLVAGGVDWPAPPAKGTGQPAQAAIGGCDFATPCPDEPEATKAPAPGTAQPRNLLTPIVGTIGLAAVLGGSLVALRRRRAIRHAAPGKETNTPISGDNDAT